MKRLIDLGERSFIEKEIEQYRNLQTEIQDRIDELELKLTHDQGSTYVQRVKWMGELKSQKLRIKYYQERIEGLKHKLSRFEDQQKHH